MHCMARTHNPSSLICPHCQEQFKSKFNKYYHLKNKKCNQSPIEKDVIQKLQDDVNQLKTIAGLAEASKLVVTSSQPTTGNQNTVTTNVSDNSTTSNIRFDDIKYISDDEIERLSQSSNLKEALFSLIKKIK